MPELSCCFLNNIRNPMQAFGQVALDAMLPNSHHCPTKKAQARKISAVALPCIADLSPPKCGQFVFPQRESPSMPEIAVDKDGDSALPKNEIGPARQVR